MKSKVDQALQALYEKHGVLTPEIVLNDARRKSSPLHYEFDWDDSTAAHRWRIEQARKLIVSRFELPPPTYQCCARHGEA